MRDHMPSEQIICSSRSFWSILSYTLLSFFRGFQVGALVRECCHGAMAWIASACVSLSGSPMRCAAHGRAVVVMVAEDGGCPSPCAQSTLGVGTPLPLVLTIAHATHRAPGAQLLTSACRYDG